MKCLNDLAFGWKNKSALGRPPKMLASITPGVLFKTTIGIPGIISYWETCNGDIVANVHKEYQGNYEGEALFEDAGIDVEFKCEKCGNTVFPDLPRYAEELNQFLTKIVKEM